MSRRTFAVDYERERERDRDRPSFLDERDERTFQELDLYRGRERGADYARSDFGRVDNQQLVVRGRETESFSRPSTRARSVSTDDRNVDVRVRKEREEWVRPIPRPRSPSPELDRNLDIRIKREREEWTRPIPRPRTPSPEPERNIDIRIKSEREKWREPERSYRETDRELDVSLRRRDSSSDYYYSPRDHERERELDISIRRQRERERERTPEPPRFREKERELDISIRREREERSISPRPRRERRKEEDLTIAIRREKTRSPSPPPAPPPPRIIEAPTIHQEIITHHRHIDHGTERAPSPPRPARKEKKEEEIDIRIRASKSRDRSRRRGNRESVDEDFIFERESRRNRVRDDALALRRRRSMSTRRRSESRINIDIRSDEEEDTRRKRRSRADKWNIVDVPAGTERRRNGAEFSEEITVRRSKMDRGARRSGGGYEFGARSRYNDMWTEITKDLCVREAIQEMGYEFDETDRYFYIIEYLRYEDVLQLVERSQEIRRSHRSSVDIRLERDRRSYSRPRHDRRYYDDRFVEKDVLIESGGRYRY